MSSPDPERVREALEDWPHLDHYGRADHDEVAEAVMRAWLAGSSPDYEAAAVVVRELLERIPVTLDLADDVSRDATLWAVQIIHAAFPGLFEERP